MIKVRRILRTFDSSLSPSPPPMICIHRSTLGGVQAGISVGADLIFKAAGFAGGLVTAGSVLVGVKVGCGFDDLAARTADFFAVYGFTI